MTRTGLFERQELRLAAHHAIDKQAISRALFAGKALPIDVAAAHGTLGYPNDFRFTYDPAKAAALVRQAGFGPDNPARMGFYATKGVFPNDFELAQAIAGMWRKVGIEANPEPVALAKYFELLHATKLPEAMLYSWGNTTGDPEMYGGYLFDPKSAFASYKSDDLSERVGRLLIETDTRETPCRLPRSQHLCDRDRRRSFPLLQVVKTVAYQDRLRFTKYDNGWILPQTFSVSA